MLSLPPDFIFKKVRTEKQLNILSNLEMVHIEGHISNDGARKQSTNWLEKQSPFHLPKDTLQTQDKTKYRKFIKKTGQ